jgi:hypothetical protein
MSKLTLSKRIMNDLLEVQTFERNKFAAFIRGLEVVLYGKRFLVTLPDNYPFSRPILHYIHRENLDDDDEVFEMEVLLGNYPKALRQYLEYNFIPGVHLKEYLVDIETILDGAAYELRS